MINKEKKNDLFLNNEINDKINMNIIYNSDLLENKYSEDILIQNINNLSKKIILNTQTLSAEFCANYIFCIDDIDDGDEESYLFDINHILRKQKHLDKEYLKNLIKTKHLIEMQ